MNKASAYRYTTVRVNVEPHQISVLVRPPSRPSKSQFFRPPLPTYSPTRSLTIHPPFSVTQHIPQPPPPTGNVVKSSPGRGLTKQTHAPSHHAPFSTHRFPRTVFRAPYPIFPPVLVVPIFIPILHSVCYFHPIYS